MMDKNDTSGESLLLIDFDLATYGYRFVPESIPNWNSKVADPSAKLPMNRIS